MYTRVDRGVDSLVIPTEYLPEIRSVQMRESIH